MRLSSSSKNALTRWVGMRAPRDMGEMTPAEPPPRDERAMDPGPPVGIWMVKAAGAPMRNGELPSSSSASSSRADEWRLLREGKMVLVEGACNGLSGNCRTAAAR